MPLRCGFTRCAWLCACLALAPSADVTAATLCHVGASGACDRSASALVQAEHCESEAMYALCFNAALMTSTAGGGGHCYCSDGLPRRCSDLCYALASGHGGFNRDENVCSSICPDYVTRRNAARASGAQCGSEGSDGGGIGSECSTPLYQVVVIVMVVALSLLVVVAILFTSTSRCGSRSLGEAFSKPRAFSAKTWSASDVRSAPRKPSGNSLGQYVKAHNIKESADIAHNKVIAEAVAVTASPPLLTQLTTEKQ